MPWDIEVSGSGGSGGTGGTGMTKHGNEWHNEPYLTAADVPTLHNPNLLFNSTGMLNMNGWIKYDHVIAFRDDFIIDDFAYFLCTGNDSPDGFVSLSIPVTAGSTYCFSGYFTNNDAVKVSVLFQNGTDLNTENYVSSIVLFNSIFTTETREFKTFTIPAGIIGAAIKIEHLCSNNIATAIYKRLKVEQGSTMTDWVPCLSDPYTTYSAISGMTAADFA